MNGVDEFTIQAEPLRRALLEHCYRMLGSYQDAEDAVQETLVRGWRSFDRFEGRSTLRTWLYRIATRACLTALEARRRRPLPSAVGAPSEPEAPAEAAGDVPWLEPVPDDPAAVVNDRFGVRLAFVAALQYLEPRQRAVLLLRDVLGWPAADVAATLDTTASAVHAALLRARSRMSRVAPTETELAEPANAESKALLARYVAAFENHDIPALVDLLSSDVTWEMPPSPRWFRGRDAVRRHLTRYCRVRPGDVRLVTARANGQPAFLMYRRCQDGRYVADTLHVLTIGSHSVRRVTLFGSRSVVSAFATELIPAEA